MKGWLIGAAATSNFRRTRASQCCQRRDVQRQGWDISQESGKKLIKMDFLRYRHVSTILQLAALPGKWQWHGGSRSDYSRLGCRDYARGR